MEVILKADVKNLGYKDDIVKVRPGYGRNFLIPQGMAVVADEKGKKIMAENVKQRAHKEAKIQAEAEKTAAKLKDVLVQVPAKVGESGKIFGSVTSVQLHDALKKLESTTAPQPAAGRPCAPSVHRAILRVPVAPTCGLSGATHCE